MTAPRRVIFGCAGLRLSSGERRFFGAAQPWGFILFARNIADPAQLRALVDDLRAAVGRDAPVLIDQEGGRVQRMGPPYWRGWLPPLEQTARAIARARDPGRAMYLRGRLIAAELAAVGIDVNCAPLADIAGAATHPFLRNRCYGETPDMVATLARAMAKGLMGGGVLPVIKHLPGHGRAQSDSHLALPVVDAAADVLETSDFAPFQALNDLPLGMTGHLLFPMLDPSGPVTTSARMIALIRDRIGFGGALMTDDISMQALAGPVTARAAAALAAGCDLVLHCNGDPAEMEALTQVCPVLDGAAQARCDAALAARRASDTADLVALAKEYDALLA